MSKSSNRLINVKVLLAAVLFGLGLLAVLLMILYSSRGRQAQAPATAILKIILAPTQTLPGMPVTPTQTAGPAAVQQTPTPSDLIAVGNYVKVSGTGGDGLRLHNDASVSSKVNYVAIDAELFIVMDGPIQADGYIWWELKEPYSDEAIGWGVANYLTAVANP
jgi:hypothetical protein